MWSLLFYYALLNAVCLAVLLMISVDPPIWDEEDALADVLPPVPVGDNAATLARPAAPRTAATPLLFEIESTAVA